MSNFCMTCGKPMPPGGKFCAECGAMAGVPVAAMRDHTPTSPRSQEDIQNQVAHAARYAAGVAVASGAVAKNAFLASITEAKTIGERAVVFGALVGLVAFFLPWFTLFGTLSSSGLRAALDASWVFWLQPLSMVACFLMWSFNQSADSKKRILAARWYIVIGTLWFAPGIAAICNVFSGVVGFGGYLATASAGAILLGGVIQVTERLQVLVPSLEINH